jgi:hypothetical protein
MNRMHPANKYMGMAIRDTRMATISEVKATDAGKTSLRKEGG